MIYHITSVAWTGYIEAEYNELGYMRRVDLGNAELSEEQQKWFLNRMPRELAELQRIVEKSSAKIEEVKQEVTFDLFWDRYNEKLKSSRKKSLIVWNRLSKADQVKAFNHIKKYEGSMSPGVAKKYAETYLNAELWNN